MAMEVVNAFNRELKSLLSSKLPVSRQKMSMITKAAIKALKFYKHVVQSVEKFVHKCSSDYKVPALYVIDAIVRQSRHQFCEKDVFGPRFLRNMIPTFLCLLETDPKDYNLILRVLNLWQQNGVFPSNIVDYLIKMVDNPRDDNLVKEATAEIEKLLGPSKVPQINHNHPVDKSQENDASKSNSQEGGLINSVSQLLAKFQSSGQDATDQIKQLQNLQEKFVEQSQLLAQGQMMDCNVLTELHALMEELTRRAAQAAKEQQLRRQQEAEVKQMMQKPIIDFDYGDDSSGDEAHQEENNKPNNVHNDTEDEFVIDLDLVAQLEQMTETLAQTLALQEELRKAREQGMRLNDEPIYISDEHESSQPAPTDVNYRDFKSDKFDANSTKSIDDKMKVFDYNHLNAKERQAKQESGTLEDGEIDQLENYRERHYSQNSSSGQESSASPYSRKRHKSSKSRSRSRSSDSRGGSKRRRRKERHQSRRKNRDKERERRKKGLPALKERRINIISRTVFVGHLMKTVTEAKLLTLMEEHGAVDDFKLIPPRGCAFVTYSHRKSANKAVTHSNGTRLDGKDIKVAWAPNRGIKDSNEFRQYWDEVEGCTYIPYIRFPSNSFSKVKELLDGGGELDEDSVPENVKLELQMSMQEHEEAEKKTLDENSDAHHSSSNVSFQPSHVPSVLPNLPPMPPTMGGVPPPMPFLPPPMLMAAAMQSMRPDLMKMANAVSSSSLGGESLSSPVETSESERAASLNVNTVTSSATQGPAMSIRPHLHNSGIPGFPGGGPSLLAGGFGFPTGPRGFMPPAPPFGLPPFGPGMIPPHFLPRKS